MNNPVEIYVRRKGESKFMSRYRCCTRTDAAAHIKETLGRSTEREREREREMLDTRPSVESFISGGREFNFV